MLNSKASVSRLIYGGYKDNKFENDLHHKMLVLRASCPWGLPSQTDTKQASTLLPVDLPQWLSHNQPLEKTLGWGEQGQLLSLW